MNKCILVILMLCGAQAQGQVVFKSLKEVLLYADDHVYNIKASVAQQGVDRSKQVQARSFLYPNVAASSGYTDNLTLQPTLVPAKLFNPNAADDTYEEMTFGKEHLYNAGVQAQWDILNFQKIFAMRTSDMQAEAGRLNIAKVKYNTYNQLASTYYSILLMQKTLGIYTDNVEVTAALLKSAKDKYTKGVISEGDLNRTSIQHLQNLKNKEAAENNLQQLYKQFQSQLNTDQEICVTGDLGPYLVENTEFNTVNPEIRWQESQVRVSESVLRQTKALYYPALSFQYQYNYNWATNDFMHLSTANKMPSQYLGVKLSIPVFTGFSTKGKVKQSRSELQIQQMQLDNLRLTKSLEDETLRLQYQQSDNNLNRTKEILTLQGQNDTYTENKYEAGIISLDERLDRYNDLLAAQYNYLQSLGDFSLAQYKVYIRQINY